MEVLPERIMLRKRVITACIIVPLVVGAVLYLPKQGFTVFLVLVAFLCGWEYSTMFFAGEGISLFAYPVLISAATMYGCVNDGENLSILVLAGFIGFAVYSLVSPGDPGKRVRDFALRVLGFFYICLFLPFFSVLRKFPGGEHLIFFIAVTVYVGDTAAYFVGSKFGRMKLAPIVSPGKTVEGALASTLFGSLAGFLYLRFWYDFNTFFPYLALPLIVSTTGQVGDLIESLLKRAAGVKDSGGIFPGHGGMLDRIDSLLLNAFVVFVFLSGW